MTTVSLACTNKDKTDKWPVAKKRSRAHPSHVALSRSRGHDCRQLNAGGRAWAAIGHASATLRRNQPIQAHSALQTVHWSHFYILHSRLFYAWILHGWELHSVIHAVTKAKPKEGYVCDSMYRYVGIFTPNFYRLFLNWFINCYRMKLFNMKIELILHLVNIFGRYFGGAYLEGLIKYEYTFEKCE